MSQIDDLRRAHLATRETHQQRHETPVDACDRCHPEQRLFWDDACRIITLADVAADMAASHPDAASDIAQVAAHADDCASSRDALDEVLALPAGIALADGDVVLALVDDHGTHAPYTDRQLLPAQPRHFTPAGQLYALLNQTGPPA